MIHIKVNTEGADPNELTQFISDVIGAFKPDGIWKHGVVYTLVFEELCEEEKLNLEEMCTEDYTYKIIGEDNVP